VGWRAIVLTTAYSLGAAVPMLGIAYGGKAVMDRLRPHAQTLRLVLGVAVAATALAIAFNLDRHAQTAVPDYVVAIQDRVERSDRAERELARVRGATREAAPGLEDYGEAPTFVGINQWLNTPGERPLSFPGLRGKVVLLDFWTYSCINCLRTLPYIKAWDRTYRSQGLQIVGVHTPEFAFEHEEDNVRAAIKRLGVRYAVAMDNDFGTWDAYRNRYWPAKYLIDAEGEVRYVHFGEGSYAETETAIRSLLAEAGDRELGTGADAGRAEVAAPGLRTPETYLGSERAEGFVEPPRPGVADYTAPDPGSLALNRLAYGGRWRVDGESATAVDHGTISLAFQARRVFLVLGAERDPAEVEVLLDGEPLAGAGAGEDVRAGRVMVNGQRLYRLVDLPEATRGTLELRFEPGVTGYAFTFG
jgi:thiol-disulfide isomerase/thioredoxin